MFFWATLLLCSWSLFWGILRYSFDSHNFEHCATTSVRQSAGSLAGQSSSTAQCQGRGPLSTATGIPTTAQSVAFPPQKTTRRSGAISKGARRTPTALGSGMSPQTTPPPLQGSRQTRCKRAEEGSLQEGAAQPGTVAETSHVSARWGAYPHTNTGLVSGPPRSFT